MNSLYQTPLVIAIALTIAAIAVIGFRDREMFVSPPEQVSEGFVRRLVYKRYDRALDLVSKDSGITAERLKQFSRVLMERAGNVMDVYAEPGAIRGDEAVSTAVVRPVGGKEIPIKLQLKLENRAWLISRIPEL